jgi:hypothetical protein
MGSNVVNVAPGIQGELSFYMDPSRHAGLCGVGLSELLVGRLYSRTSVNVWKYVL